MHHTTVLIGVLVVAGLLLVGAYFYERHYDEHKKGSALKEMNALSNNMIDYQCQQPYVFLPRLNAGAPSVGQHSQELFVTQDIPCPAQTPALPQQLESAAAAFPNDLQNWVHTHDINYNNLMNNLGSTGQRYGI